MPLTLRAAHYLQMPHLTEAHIRRRLRRLGYITKRAPDGFAAAGFQVIDAMTGCIIAGEEFNLSVENLTPLLQQGEGGADGVSR
jgi:hypothetical protein